MAWHYKWCDQSLEWMNWMSRMHLSIYQSMNASVHFCHQMQSISHQTSLNAINKCNQSMDNLALYSLIALTDSIWIELFQYNYCSLSPFFWWCMYCLPSSSLSSLAHPPVRAINGYILRTYWYWDALYYLWEPYQFTKSFCNTRSCIKKLSNCNWMNWVPLKK